MAAIDLDNAAKELFGYQKQQEVKVLGYHIPGVGDFCTRSVIEKLVGLVEQEGRRDNKVHLAKVVLHGSEAIGCSFKVYPQAMGSVTEQRGDENESTAGEMSSGNGFRAPPVIINVPAISGGFMSL